MKGRGAHPSKALSAQMVRSALPPGRYGDGNGLYLNVDPSGAKRWVLRTVVLGRRRDLGLGSAQLVSLAEARSKAADWRRIARDGGDPLAEKRRAQIPTFEQAARRVHADHRGSWRNPKHAAQWLSTLEEYAFPVMGAVPVDRAAPADILRVLAPIWLAKQETARRVRQRLRTVFEWAQAAGFRQAANPTDGIAKALPRQSAKPVHHRALPYPRVPAFVEQVRGSAMGPSARLALEFLVLTAARTGEVLAAEWSEFDLQEATWVVPAVRMKAKVEHRVPLAPRCLELLREAKTAARDSRFVFPGRHAERPMSNMIFLAAMRRMKVGATAHGFRSSFRDWSAERGFSQEICEAALAHTIRNKVEAAYRRTDLFAQRRMMMEQWSAFVSGSETENVVAFGRVSPSPGG